MKQAMPTILLAALTLWGCAETPPVKKERPPVARAVAKPTKGYVRDWLACGPFPTRPLTEAERARVAATGNRHIAGLGGGLFDDYLKPVGGETGARPKPGDRVPKPGGGFLTWREYDTPMEIVDFEKTLGLPRGDIERCVVYGYTTFESGRGGKAYLELGSDDSAKAWLNGKPVYTAHVLRFDPVRDFVPVTLKVGLNRLLLKVENRGGPGRFSARVVRVLPLKVAKIAMDSSKASWDNLHVLRDVLNDHGIHWSLSDDGEDMIVRVDADQADAARRVLRKVVEAGRVKATVLPKAPAG